MLLQLLQLLLLLWKLKNRLVLGSVPSARHTDSKATDLFRYNSVDRIVDCDAVITNAKWPCSAFPILSREEAQKTNSLCSHHQYNVRQPAPDSSKTATIRYHQQMTSRGGSTWCVNDLNKILACSTARACRTRNSAFKIIDFDTNWKPICNFWLVN